MHSSNPAPLVCSAATCAPPMTLDDDSNAGTDVQHLEQQHDDTKRPKVEDGSETQQQSPDGILASAAFDDVAPSQSSIEQDEDKVAPIALLEAHLRACTCLCAKHILDKDVFECEIDDSTVKSDVVNCFEARYGEPPEHTMALCVPGVDNGQPLALVGVSKNHVLVVSASGDVHGFPCAAASGAEEALMNRQWGLHDLAILNHPEHLGKKHFQDLVRRIFGTSCSISDELFGTGRGVSKVVRMEDGKTEPMTALFNGCAFGVPGDNLSFFFLHSLQGVSSTMPSMALAVHLSTGKYCALSRHGHLIQGDLNVDGPRAFKSDWSADVLMGEAMVEYWSPQANRPFKDTMAVLENKFSLLRVRSAPDDDEPAYVISSMKDGEHILGLIPVWKRNSYEDLVRVNLVEDWLSNDVPRMVERMFFDPSKPPLLNGSDFNLFRGYGCQPVPPADRNNPCPIIMELFSEVYCRDDQELLDFFLDCLAYKFQNPGVKLGICIILRGGMGTGKSSFIAILRKICGAHVMETSSIDRLTGRFNSHIVDKMFLALNEAFFAGNHKDAAIIKSFITEPRMVLEPKFVNPQEVKICCDLIMTTNAKWVAQAARQNRRNLILDTSAQKPKWFYDALHANLDREVCELFWFLLNRRLPAGFNPSRHLQEMTPTIGAVDQLLQGQQGTIINYFLEQLQAGECTLEHHYSPVPFFSAKPVKVKAERLLGAFQTLLRSNQWLARYGDNEELDVKFTQLSSVHTLTKNFRKLFGVDEEDKDVIPNVRGTYEIPGVDVLRKAFAKMTLGIDEYDWNVEGEEDEE